MSIILYISFIRFGNCSPIDIITFYVLNLKSSLFEYQMVYMF